MNDDELLFAVDDLELWKGRSLPRDWLEQRMAALIERQRTQATDLEKVIKSAGSATGYRLNARL